MAVYEKQAITAYKKYVNDNGKYPVLDQLENELNKIDPSKINEPDSYLKPVTTAKENLLELSNKLKEIQSSSINPKIKQELANIISNIETLNTTIDSIINQDGLIYQDLKSFSDNGNKIINTIKQTIFKQDDQTFSKNYHLSWIIIISISGSIIVLMAISSLLYLIFYTKKFGIEIKRRNKSKQLANKIKKIYQKYPEVKEMVDYE